MDGLSWVLPLIGNVNVGQTGLLILAIWMLQRNQGERIKELAAHVTAQSNELNSINTKLAGIDRDVVRLQASEAANSARRAEDRNDAASAIRELSDEVRRIHTRFDQSDTTRRHT